MNPSPQPPPVPYPHAHAQPAGAAAAALPVHSGPLECPICRAPTLSLKKHTYLAYLVFIGIFAFWSVKHTLACPPCLRKELLWRLAFNTVLANVLWPIVVLPWNGILLALSFSAGHSRGVAALAKDRSRG